MLIHHATHHVVEVRIAAVHNGPAQIVLGVGPVTTDDIAVAHNVRAFRNDALQHADEALHHLENGPRSVAPLTARLYRGFQGCLAKLSYAAPRLVPVNKFPS